MKFVSNGVVDGTLYVTVLDDGDNVIEYSIPITEASEKYDER